MANGATRIVNAELVRKNPKGSALKSALETSKINNALKSVTGNEKQPIKK